ncbi:hypothetical protein ACYX78_07115 [Advenella incenata]|jgi:hypothetical protein
MIYVDEIRKIININAMEESPLSEIYSEISTIAKIDIEESRLIFRHVLTQMIEDNLVGIYQYSNETTSTPSFVEISLDEALNDAMNSYLYSKSA